MYLVKSTQFVNPEEQLRPADARVFRILKDAALHRPGEFVPMKQIAAQAFKVEKRTDLQIKNLVQRSVYEIRQRFGREAVLSKGAGYRLGTATAPDAGSRKRFASRIRIVLESARTVEAATLERIWFFGEEAAAYVEESIDMLLETLQAFRMVRILTPSPKQALELVEKLEEMGKPQMSPYLQVFVTPCPGASGVARIDKEDGECFVELCGPQQEPVLVATGAGARQYFKHYDSRWEQLEPLDLGDLRPIVIDSFDALTWKEWQRAQTGYLSSHRGNMLLRVHAAKK